MWIKRFRKFALVKDGKNWVFVRDNGEARVYPGGVGFGSHLWLDHFRNGKRVDHRDLGSGLVTNVGVLAMANDFAWAQNAQTLKLTNFHGSGTGTTAAATTDITLQTPLGTIASTGGLTLLPGVNIQKYQSVGTVSYGASASITEWGLFTGQMFAGLTTGSPFTATTTTSATVTGTPYTASSATVQGQQQTIVKAGTTNSYGLITSNTTSVLTLPSWFNISTGSTGLVPGATEAFSIFPTMWDHRVFAAVTVNSGDQIVFTYQLTVNSGG